MATVVYIEKDGELIDITDAHRAVKTRCDGCSEFVPDYDVSHVNITVHRAGVPLAQRFLEGHADHVLSEASDLLAQLAEKLAP